MRILLIHNKYKHAGGEDSVFEAEEKLLKNEGNTVKTFFFDNSEINTISSKIKLSYQIVYNQHSRQVIDSLISEFKPEVIHVHNFFYIASPSVFYSAYKNNIPVVVTLHNYRLICSGSLLMRDSVPCELCVNQVFPLYGIKYACHRGSSMETAQLTITTGVHKLIGTWRTKVSKFITLTEFAREKFINSSLKLCPEKVVVKYNSVDDVLPSDYLGRQNFFLYLGRLSEEKGIQVILEAFAGTDITIKIIGDGPLRPDVVKIAAANSNIEYLGYRDKSFIISQLKSCRALIVPSICYECLPTAILEAFSCGTPVVISDIDNLSQIVSHGYNGIHFKTNNAADLYNATKNFIANISHYHDLYINSHKTFLAKYTKEINYRQLMAIYTDVINSYKTNISRT